VGRPVGEVFIRSFIFLYNLILFFFYTDKYGMFFPELGMHCDLYSILESLTLCGRSASPSVLFFDELDGLAGIRGGGKSYRRFNITLFLVLFNTIINSSVDFGMDQFYRISYAILGGK
jgi:hypothetical protein